MINISSNIFINKIYQYIYIPKFPIHNIYTLINIYNKFATFSNPFIYTHCHNQHVITYHRIP